MRTFAQKPKTTQQITPAKSTIRRRECLGQSQEMNLIFHLQHTIGNHAVQRMLQTHPEELKFGLTRAAPSHFGHDFSRIPVSPPNAGAVQTKLAINKQGDEYEQEADRVAEQVMRMPEPQLQRTCACGGMCPNCHTEHPTRHDMENQISRVKVSDAERNASPSTVHEILHSPGQPLDSAVRSFFEPRYGHDFSQVQVHTDSRASESARAINAHAYTFGNHIVFAKNQYQPGRFAGRHLLAHELAHVVQQSRGGERVQFDRDQGEHGGTDDGVAEASERNFFERLYDMLFATYWFVLSPVERYAVIQDKLEVFERIDPLTRLSYFISWCFEVRGYHETGGLRVNNCLHCETTKGFLGLREEKKCYYPFDRAAGFFFRNEDELREAEDRAREQVERQKRRSGITQEEFERRGRQLKAELNLGAIQNAILGTTKVVGTAASAATAVQDAYNCVHHRDEESCVKAGQSFLSNFSKGMLER